MARFRPTGKDVVIVLALVGAGAYGSWVALEAGGGLGTDWTDGVRVYEGIGDDVRYAIWDDPRRVQGGINSQEHEGRASISPDGRVMVFQVGHPGLGSDLYVAELVDGVAVDPRPLDAVNSPFDDLAPAFASDALLFASDRAGPEFGLDLWRAPYSEGGFGPPEPIGPGLNTSADETDPLPLGGSREILFASNRERGLRTDFDLYVAAPAIGTPEDEGYEVLPIPELASPFDEREPGVTADGRVLVFASDRSGGQGGFDLYRSLRDGSSWLPPSPLEGLNTPAGERAPLVSQDGFSLTYSREQPASPGPDLEPVAAATGPGALDADLYRARSKELFPLPPRAMTLLDLLVLLALLILALLAFLAKRWRGMEVLYKCFLVSCLIHLLLLWYLNSVHPEGSPTSFGDDDPSFRVRLERSGSLASGGNSERGGAVEAERTLVEPVLEPGRMETETQVAAATPAERSIDRQSHEQALPGREGVEQTPAAARTESDVRLEDQDAPVERYDGAAPALSLAAGPTQAAPAPSSASTPSRNQVADGAATPDATSTFQALARGDRATDAVPRPSEVAAQPAQRAAEGGTEVALHRPQESFERKTGDVAGFALPAAASMAAPTRDAAGPERALDLEPTAISATAGSDPLPRETSPLASVQPPPDTGGDLPQRRQADDPSPTLASGEPAVALQRPDEAFERKTGDVAGFDLPEAVSRTAQALATEGLRPERDQEFAVEAARPGNDPLPREASPLANVQRPELSEGSLPQRRQTDDPAPTRIPTEPEVALLDEEVLPQRPEPIEAAAPPRFDATSALQTEARQAPRVVAADPVPRRFALERGVEPDRAPTRRAFDLADGPEAPADDVPRRMEHTPYRNRFGEEKEKALELYGGGVETEAAVKAGLEYLAGTQRRDGYWGDAGDFHEKYRHVLIGKTGLSLLAFLGAGHTQDSETEHSAVVRRAIAFLLAQQDEGTGHFGNSSAYSHGIATYALAECYALTEDPALRGPLERAVDHIVSHQVTSGDERNDGGWGYFYPDGAVWNNDRWPRVSVTAWQVMALESARLGGLAVDDNVFRRARNFLARAWDSRRGAFRYDHDPGRLNSSYPILPASTPAAIFALSLLGVAANGDQLAGARNYVLERTPREFRYEGDNAFVHQGQGNLYFWYYGTLAMFRAGGTAWQRWNTGMKETLLEGQNSDGSWEPISIYASAYAGDDRQDKSYATAMCVLTLEVYYRYFTPLLEVEVR